VRGRRSCGRSVIPADRRRPVLTPRPSSLGWGRQGLGEEERTPARGGQPQRRRSALEGQQERRRRAAVAVGNGGRGHAAGSAGGGGGQQWRWATVAVDTQQAAGHGEGNDGGRRAVENG